MHSIFYELPRPTIFAHRGASAHAPENTLASFELALQMGTDAIELDTKLTADGHVIVIHDATVDRTTNGTGDVRKMSLAQIRELDAGSFFDIAYQGEPIPTLEEVFQAIGSKAFINVELTNYSSPSDALPEKVTRLVQRYALEDRILFSSFNPLTLLRAHRALPQVPLGLLALPKKPGILARSFLIELFPCQALHVELRDVSVKLVERLHRKAKYLNVYTVNELNDMRRLAEMHVDGFFTDDPVLARKILAE